MKKKKFQSLLVLSMAVSIAFPSAEAAAADSPALKMGSKGTSVKQLQLDLKKETAPKKAQRAAYPSGFSRDLKKGMSGNDVGKLQSYLIKLGQTLKADKKFGTQTYNAVVSFQKKNKLNATGTADFKTLNAIVKANTTASAAKPLAPAVPVPYPEGFKRTLKSGHQGPDVRLLQAYLTKAGYRVGVDEVFGKNTFEALRKFQQSIKYKDNGIAGPKTLTRLVLKATVSPAYKGYSFSGKGWGHAVGMTQWGALGMAQKGFGYHDILKYYYTGVDFKKIDTSKQNIRVCLSKEKASVDLNGTGSYSIQDMQGNVLFEPAAQTPTNVTVEDGEFLLTNGDETAYIDQPFKVVSVKGKYLSHKKMNYNGVLEVSFSDNKKKRINVINRLNVETYLQGVVPSEVSSKWHPEAIKAQTLAARTYALKHLSPAGKWDVYDTVDSQVYKGVGQEAANVNAIINGETKGEVITYKGALINAYFSASAGGYTVGSGFVWSTDLPYLVGKPDPYDQSKYAKNWWTYELSFEEISKRAASFNIGEVVDIKIVEKKYTRPTKVRITGFNGTIEVSGSAFRKLMNGDAMKSAIYSADLVKNEPVKKESYPKG
ncbi:SpoIID/LytB domain-containing protein [Fictibacillus sp. B-59209]|uniref:SpoIID/LytB domain-containing protein n=1 Tax=Fictibacillus sp. B-59209 TaxID=3024873 RepID=UPI002E1C1FEF|nr:SpoIID/LytB domain-containing protein [Fictibacillus sp. B-59209]